MWWKLAVGAACLALAGFLITLYGKARHNEGRLAERVVWNGVVARHERAVADLRVGFERQRAEATEGYAARLAARAPLVVRSGQVVARFAATPAGAVRCLAAERVRGIEADRAAIFPGYPGAAVSGNSAVPADPLAAR